METNEKLYYLMEQVRSGSATDAEYEELLSLIDDETLQQMHAFYQERLHTGEPAAYNRSYWQQAFGEMLAALKPAPVRRVSMLRYWAAAAAILLLLAGGAYFWPTSQPASHIKHMTDVAPGRQGAILVLANGSTIVLDSLQNGKVASQQGADAVLQNGRLVYLAKGTAKDAVSYNTMKTPKGRQFQLTLPDGTKVWLNAASSVRYPTAFTGKERRVQVNGEAYFEVAQQSDRPFFVEVAGRTEIQVLGTSFNIHAYEDENYISTVLLQGAVRVTGGGTQVVLKPGQQAQLQQQMKVLNNVNTARVMAWKNGIFDFEDVTLEEAMRELQRWYDIEVVYENGVPNIPFSGKVDRNVSLSGLLKLLAGADLKFRIEEGKRLVILNQ